MGQFAQTHFAEFGKVSLPCPFSRINFRQGGHRNSAKWARQLSTSAKRLFESENIMWGISGVCTLALTVADQLPQRSLRNLRSR